MNDFLDPESMLSTGAFQKQANLFDLSVFFWESLRAKLTSFFSWVNNMINQDVHVLYGVVVMINAAHCGSSYYYLIEFDFFIITAFDTTTCMQDDLQMDSNRK